MKRHKNNQVNIYVTEKCQGNRSPGARPFVYTNKIQYGVVEILWPLADLIN